MPVRHFAPRSIGANDFEAVTRAELEQLPGDVRKPAFANALRERGKRRGIATLCIGGGEAVALGVERV